MALLEQRLENEVCSEAANNEYVYVSIIHFPDDSTYNDVIANSGRLDKRFDQRLISLNLGSLPDTTPPSIWSNGECVTQLNTKKAS